MVSKELSASAKVEMIVENDSWKYISIIEVYSLSYNFYNNLILKDTVQ
jgi:hypothetical protein